jgi:serine/threonine protein kinase
MKTFSLTENKRTALKKKMSETERKKKIARQPLKLGAEIGSGTFGSVYRIQGDQTSVVKMYDPADNLDVVNHARVREWAAMKTFHSCSSPHFVKMKTAHFTKKHGPIVVMDAYDGDLSHALIRTHAEVSSIIFQILCALQCMQNRNLMHRDLKGHNVLVRKLTNKTLQVSLCDFGSCCFIEPSVDAIMTENVCTLTHRAPEVFTEKHYDEKIDVWAAGVICAELFLPGNHLFWKPKETPKRVIRNAEIREELENQVTLKNIHDCLGNPRRPNKLEIGLDRQLQTLRQQKEEKKKKKSVPRGSIPPLLHRFFPITPPPRCRYSKKTRPVPPSPNPPMLLFLQSMLQVDPNKRATVAELLAHPLFVGLKCVEDPIVDPLQRLRLMDVSRNVPCGHESRSSMTYTLYLISENMKWTNPHTFFASVEILDTFLSQDKGSSLSLSLICASIGILAESLFEAHFYSYRSWVKRNSLSKYSKKQIRDVIHRIERVLEHRFYFTSEWMYTEHFLKQVPESVAPLALHLLSAAAGHPDFRIKSKEAIAQATVTLACEIKGVSIIPRCSYLAKKHVSLCCEETSKNKLSDLLLTEAENVIQ